MPLVPGEVTPDLQTYVHHSIHMYRESQWSLKHKYQVNTRRGCATCTRKYSIPHIPGEIDARVPLLLVQQERQAAPGVPGTVVGSPWEGLAGDVVKCLNVGGGWFPPI